MEDTPIIYKVSIRNELFTHSEPLISFPKKTNLEVLKELLTQLNLKWQKEFDGVTAEIKTNSGLRVLFNGETITTLVGGALIDADTETMCNLVPELHKLHKALIDMRDQKVKDLCGHVRNLLAL